RIAELSKHCKSMLVVEMNGGQMLRDVQMAVSERIPVEFYGRMGGVIPFPDEIYGEIRRMLKESLPIGGDPSDRWLKRMTAQN
ncbi:MAG: 3-methyl-2-oxobutanoate dehydrogenase subunit beta, partial [Anaerolineaceae bacterium]